nr:iron-sulfur cluster assembly 1 [Halisarca dujardinii]
MAARIASTVRVSVGKLGRFVPTRKAIDITPTAVRKIKDLLTHDSSAVGLRVGVKTRGCNGLSYALSFVGEKGKLDEEVEVDGARVFIDPKALLTVIGTQMDFVEDKLGSEFVFHNPNAKGTCGCGESFTV